MENIRNMTLSKKWLGNPSEYKIVESYIYNIFFKILHEINEDIKNWTTPFFNTHFYEGFDDINGNPIFSAKNNLEQYIIKAVIDEDYNDITTFKSDFDDMPMYTIYLTSDYMNEIQYFFKQVINNQKF
ncbi:hypothetical protein [Psychrobacter sp. I-STPA10]|uniref:hypothetical protein n=1 Tax=Psychrobacter sp. I-STPA10 TaxID=2585769 RepID=UPI001E489B1A|nr:hypothetical protein [Psychrobacter sp. I-STPA10]